MRILIGFFIFITLSGCGTYSGRLKYRSVGNYVPGDNAIVNLETYHNNEFILPCVKHQEFHIVVPAASNRTSSLESAKNISVKREFRKYRQIKTNKIYLQQDVAHDHSDLNKNDDIGVERTTEPLGLIGFSSGAGLILIAFILGLGILQSGPFLVIGILTGAIIALTLGVISLSRISKNPNLYKGKAFSVLAIVIGSIGTLIGGLLLLFINNFTSCC